MINSVKDMIKRNVEVSNQKLYGIVEMYTACEKKECSYVEI